MPTLVQYSDITPSIPLWFCASKQCCKTKVCDGTEYKILPSECFAGILLCCYCFEPQHSLSEEGSWSVPDRVGVCCLTDSSSLAHCVSSFGAVRAGPRLRAPYPLRQPDRWAVMGILMCCNQQNASASVWINLLLQGNQNWWWKIIDVIKRIVVTIHIAVYLLSNPLSMTPKSNNSNNTEYTHDVM